MVFRVLAATWIDVDPVTNEEMIRGYGRIEKARWKLVRFRIRLSLFSTHNLILKFLAQNCQLCKEKHGTKGKLSLSL